MAIKTKGVDTFPETLYHYTSNSVFLSILKNHSIWLSSRWHLNDTKEGCIFKEIVQSRHLKNGMGNPTEINRRIDSFGFYVNCLTAAHDMLSQWRGYAGDGTGVAIGFDRDILKKSVFENKSELFLAKVEYVKSYDDLEEDKRSLIDKMLQSRSEPTQGFINSVVKTVWSIKAKAFVEEQEYRIIFTPLINDTTTQTRPNILRNFRATQDSIREYYELGFGEEDFKSLIKSVTLGPKNSSDEDAVKGLLEKSGLPNVEVLRSEATYR